MITHSMIRLNGYSVGAVQQFIEQVKGAPFTNDLDEEIGTVLDAVVTDDPEVIKVTVNLEIELSI